MRQLPPDVLPGRAFCLFVDSTLIKRLTLIIDEVLSQQSVTNTQRERWKLDLAMSDKSDKQNITIRPGALLLGL